jgi:RecJ-like exonuclease
MTIAICTECGSTKFGAFSQCEDCGFTPSSDAERAKSVMMSDHHYTPFELEILSESLRTGKQINYDPEIVAEYERTLNCLESDPEALQCTVCGEDLDSFDETLCPDCREREDNQ